MKLFFVFGVWMNLQSVAALVDFSYWWHTRCGVYLKNQNNIVVIDRSCDEVAAEINRQK